MSKKTTTTLSSKVSNLQNFMERYGEQINSLTDEEIQVLLMISSGLEESDIACSANIPISDVKILHSNIKKKLSIETKEDYEEYAIALDLIRIWFDSLSIVLEKDFNTRFSMADSLKQ
ncbi:LuxR C-terminal-related transcriptional regulator [Aliifodinibius sp. S!AR15-10]|uniref:helix-turn-helix transcriptional regulator n=1 Tax=Aliifodinibius sp. S!AR15-10 TaxID=2950437 RepID=UPI00285B5E1D|nr:LuxR C-terminal-related transcriptional regulator [Aliifodinibius sp. S!AR15-10]MDR8391311.1 LuxR C-terminal-related transcriptional regulator [Aliifodinibius sp. S!AR15-10]